MAKLPRVSDYMDLEVFSVRAGAQIFDAVDFLLKQRRTGAPVVNDDDELVGMLSEKDCLKLLTTGEDNDMPSGTVSDYMTSEVQTVPPNMNVYFAAGLFLNTHVRRFPVVDQGKLVGVITRFDILRAIQTFIR